MMIAHASGNTLAGGSMTRSLTVSNSSSEHSEVPQRREEIDERKIPSELISSVTSSYADRIWALKARIDSPGNDAICYEARNCLQVILSGAEILLEDHLANLLAGQKELLTKMTDNAYHLCNLLSMLLGPEEFKVEKTTEESFKAVRAPAKV
jgi:hypothetical protein